MSRIMAIDYGPRRIGLAVSDESNILATPLHTIDTKTSDDPLEKIINFIKELEIKKIVVGYPLRTDGTLGNLAPRIDEFVAHLKKKTGVEILKYDESYSSSNAREIILKRTGKKTKSGKDQIDRFAASLFLQEYLDKRRE
jgi:putative Holliday junction resolvase